MANEQKAKEKTLQTAHDVVRGGDAGQKKLAESKADKFRRLANRRVPRMLRVIGHVANLGNTNVYQFTDQQRDKLLSMVDGAVKDLRQSFAGKSQIKTVDEF